jgi:hypothetical protein
LAAEKKMEEDELKRKKKKLDSQICLIMWNGSWCRFPILWTSHTSGYRQHEDFVQRW